MMMRIHDLDTAAGAAYSPTLSTAASSVPGGGLKCNNGSNSSENMIGARFLRLRHRMSRHQMHAGRNIWADVLDDCLFHRTDISHNGARTQAVRDSCGDIRIRTDRRTEHHEIGAFNGFSRGFMNTVKKAELNARSNVSRLRVEPEIWPTRPSRFATRASEEPSRPRPIKAIRSKRGCSEVITISGVPRGCRSLS